MPQTLEFRFWSKPNRQGAERWVDVGQFDDYSMARIFVARSGIDRRDARFVNPPVQA